MFWLYMMGRCYPELWYEDIQCNSLTPSENIRTTSGCQCICTAWCWGHVSAGNGSRAGATPLLFILAGVERRTFLTCVVCRKITCWFKTWFLSGLGHQCLLTITQHLLTRCWGQGTGEVGNVLGELGSTPPSTCASYVPSHCDRLERLGWWWVGETPDTEWQGAPQINTNWPLWCTNICVRVPPQWR